MSNNEFFDNQTDLTASKILIYREYLTGYLPKVLMQYGKCFIADFFCGPGKNGKEDGSPLVLLDIAKKTLENPVISNKWPEAEIVVIFSDDNETYCDALKKHLKDIDILRKIRVIGPYCKDFVSIKKDTLNVFSKINAPKFFFLDPFNYSDINIEDVKDLMSVPSAEVLLFIPTFFSYRFIKSASKIPALKNFLESFTTRGCADYNDINDFNESIRHRLRSYLNLKYVRAVGLDAGAQKNALFYMTGHIVGMLLMNKLVWKRSSNGVIVKSKCKNNLTLFDLSKFSGNYEKIETELINYIKEKGRVSNTEIIDFVAQNCFDTKYANEILKKMKKYGAISVEYLKSDKTRGFYVADNNWNDELANVISTGA